MDAFKQKEKDRLDKLVDHLAELMKKRLNEKVDEGYAGWDQQIFIPTITSDLKCDVTGLNRHIKDMLKKSDGILPLAPDPADVTRLVDIMNRAGFLIYALLDGKFGDTKEGK